MTMLPALLIAVQTAPAAGAAAAPPTAAARPTPAAVGSVPRPTPTRAQVEAAVRSEWPRFDTARTGRLNPLQFSTWVLRANGATVKPAGATSRDPGIKPVTAMNATARAFATADADHDGGVTPAEMAIFLMR